MAENTVTIRAEMLTDIPEKAAESAAAIKDMTSAVGSSSTAAGGAAEELGKQLDTVHKRTEEVAGGGQKLSAQYKELHEQGRKVRDGIAHLGETIHQKLQYPLQQLSFVMEGASLGMLTFGLTTASSLQQANLALSMFTGSANMAGNAVSQLRGMQGAVGLGALTGGYETLGQSGMGQAQVLPMMRALTGISDTSLNPGGSMQALSQAVASMTSTGLLTPADMSAFTSSSMGSSIWGMLGGETNQTAAQLRTRFLRAGQPMALPANFLNDIMGSPQAKGGQAAYQATFAGQFEDVKKSFGNMLAVFETPLGNALSGAATKLDAWTTQTENRFKQMGGAIGHEWSSGNMGALGGTLAKIVGDPKLAGDFQMVATALHGFGNVVVHDLIPAGKDILTVAAPALSLLANTLDFLGKERGLTEGIIVTLGGFVILSKMAAWGQTAAAGIELFSKVLMNQGALTAMGAWTRGLAGLRAAQMGEAGTAGITAAEGAAGVPSTSAIVAGSGAAAGLNRFLGPAAGAALGGYGFVSAATSKHYGLAQYGESVGGGALAGASIGSIIPGIGTVIGGGIGAAAGGITGLIRSGLIGSIFGGNSSPHAATAAGGGTNIRAINITVPGSGNPAKVANAIPKAINAQVAAHTQMAARRAGSN